MMTPDRGGTPLPDAPTCGAGDTHAAQTYVRTLQEALDQDGWSQNQRRTIRARLTKWQVRAAGLDPFFNRRGNIPGNPDGPPPTQTEITVTRWRRQHQSRNRDHAKSLSAKAKLKAEELAADKEHDN